MHSKRACETSYPPFSSMLCFFHKDNSSLGPRWMSCFHKTSEETKENRLSILSYKLWWHRKPIHSAVWSTVVVTTLIIQTHLWVVQSSPCLYCRCQCSWRISGCAATDDKSDESEQFISVMYYNMLSIMLSTPNNTTHRVFYIPFYVTSWKGWSHRLRWWDPDRWTYRGHCELIWHLKQIYNVTKRSNPE